MTSPRTDTIGFELEVYRRGRWCSVPGYLFSSRARAEQALAEFKTTRPCRVREVKARPR